MSIRSSSSQQLAGGAIKQVYLEKGLGSSLLSSSTGSNPGMSYLKNSKSSSKSWTTDWIKDVVEWLCKIWRWVLIWGTFAEIESRIWMTWDVTSTPICLMSEMVWGISSKVGGLKEGAATVCGVFHGSSRMFRVESAKWRLFANSVMEVNPENVLS